MEGSPTSTPSVEILQSWGVASARHTSGCPVYPSGDATSSAVEHLYDVPLGPCLVRWDLLHHRRVLHSQAHSDLIMCAQRSPDRRLIASSAYSGGVKLWSSEWVCLDSTRAPMQSQFHLSWSPDSKRFLVLGNGRHSSIVIYDVVSNSDSNFELKQRWHLHAIGTPFPPQDPDGDSTGKTDHGGVPAPPTMGRSEEVTSSSMESGLNYPYEEAFYMAEFNQSGRVFAVKEIPYRTTLLYLISTDGCIEKVEDLMKLMGKEDCSKGPVNTIFISAYRNGVYAIGMEGGYIALIDAELLKLNNAFKVGSGFCTGLWDGEYLVVHSDSGKVMWWDEGGEKVLEFDTGFSDIVVHMDWSVSGQGLWVCGFSCLTYHSVERSDGRVKTLVPSLSVTCHELTSVGVAFDPTGTKLASGDMVGRVWITEENQVTPVHQFSVSGSVRCLAWANQESLLVGTLDGAVQLWTIGHTQPHPLLQLQGSIIHIRFDHKHEFLAVGSSQGQLLVYGVKTLSSGEVKCNMAAEVNAHPPQPGKQDQRFGQLTKQAEIWSLCWSPDDSKLATCSEDQTVKVWDTASWKCLTTLRGHKLAVTSVDWTQRGSASLLVSCSDDRTVRLVDGDTYKLLSVVDTKDIYGWHTLTYLTFYPFKDSCLLLCTTQNGHLVIWKVLQPVAMGEGCCPSSTHPGSSPTPAEAEGDQLLRRLWKGKLHLGSVEGLVWQQEVRDGSIATVGADCVVNLFKLRI